MNVDAILDALNRHEVEYLLIGGVNFLLRHQPVMTFDVDVWIRDTEANRGRCEQALVDLQAEWGASDADWGPVSRLPTGWLSKQSVFCMTTSQGALDVFRSLAGVASWDEAMVTSVEGRTSSGIRYLGVGDRDMLLSQEALPESERKQDRVAYLKRVLSEC